MRIVGRRVRDTADGRQAIAEQLARLREWCQQTETPWLPPFREPEPAPEADRVG